MTADMGPTSAKQKLIFKGGRTVQDAYSGGVRKGSFTICEHEINTLIFFFYFMLCIFHDDN